MQDTPSCKVCASFATRRRRRDWVLGSHFGLSARQKLPFSLARMRFFLSTSLCFSIKTSLLLYFFCLNCFSTDTNIQALTNKFLLRCTAFAQQLWIEHQQPFMCSSCRRLTQVMGLFLLQSLPIKTALHKSNVAMMRFSELNFRWATWMEEQQTAGMKEQRTATSSNYNNNINNMRVTVRTTTLRDIRWAAESRLDLGSSTAGKLFY